MADTAALKEQLKSLEDVRRPLSECFEEKRAEIDELRSRVADLIPQADDALKLDDLALLRYTLSAKGDMEKAVTMVTKTIEWRTAKRDMLICAREGKPHPMHERITKYAIAQSLVTTWGSPIFIIRAGKSDPGALVSKFESEDVIDWLMFQRERAWLVCDYISRHTGLLTKAITVVDLAGLSMWGVSWSFGGLIGQTSKLSEAIYPQLLEKSVIMNMPGFVSLVWKVARMFLTEQTLSKTTACQGDGKPEKLGTCPFVSKRFVSSDLPPYLGGTNEEGDVINGLLRARTVLAAYGDLYTTNADMAATALSPHGEAPASSGAGEATA